MAEMAGAPGGSLSARTAIPWVTTLARYVLAGVLIAAGWLKIGTPALSVEAVKAYRLLPEGVATAVGVWLFNQAIGLVHRVVSDGVAAALAPLGVWTLVPIIAAGGIVVWLIVRLLRPEPLGAVPHIIDGILEHDGRLNDRNAAVTVAGAAVGIGFGMPLGADW